MPLLRLLVLCVAFTPDLQLSGALSAQALDEGVVLSEQVGSWSFSVREVRYVVDLGEVEEGLPRRLVQAVQGLDDTRDYKLGW